MGKELRCDDCGGELSCCGPMTEDGPLLDCLLCQLHAKLTTLRTQLATANAERDKAESEVEVSMELLTAATERIDRLRAMADAGDRIISRFSLNGTMLAILGTSGYPKYKAACDTHHDLDTPNGETR